MKKLFGLFVLTMLCSSHDLFLKTDSYFLKTNSLVKLYLFNGTFDQSENEITRDRIIASSISGPGFNFIPAKGNWYGLNNATYLQFKSKETGTYMAGISTAAKNIELSAEDFNGYLEHDGILDEIEARRKEGRMNDDAVEKYSKHVKCLIQVGDSRSDHYNLELGYPIEFILENNPYDLGVEDEINFQLLRDGKPLANQLVYYGHRKNGIDASKGHVHDTSYLRIDSNGKGSVKLTEAGHWYLRTIHMERRSADGLDYESNWATITFEIK